MRVDASNALKIWYEGLGEIFRERSHYRKNDYQMMRLYDDPKKRLLLYSIATSIFLVLSFGFFSLGFVFSRLELFKVISGTCYLCFIVGLVSLWFVFRTFINVIMLRSVIKSGESTDLNDEMRMKMIMKAVDWGIKEGYIRKGKFGNMFFTNKKH